MLALCARECAPARQAIGSERGHAETTLTADRRPAVVRLRSTGDNCHHASCASNQVTSRVERFAAPRAFRVVQHSFTALGPRVAVMPIMRIHRRLSLIAFVASIAACGPSLRGDDDD